MSKVYAIGDIHGNYEALKQCIKRSGIDREKDTLIVLGDVVDGWYEIKECVKELLTFKNLIPIRGNHDQWFMNWILKGDDNLSWICQGGQATKDSYNQNSNLVLEHVKDYFNKSKYYYIDDKNRLFVHGGCNWHKDIEDNDMDDIMWNRHMYTTALQWEAFSLTHPTKSRDYFKSYHTVFVGHTTTQWNAGWKYNPGTKPVFASNLINLDTGAGYNGKLTIMNVDNTDEFYQSDDAGILYPRILNSRR